MQPDDFFAEWMVWIGSPTSAWIWYAVHRPSWNVFIRLWSWWESSASVSSTKNFYWEPGSNMQDWCKGWATRNSELYTLYMYVLHVFINFVSFINATANLDGMASIFSLCTILQTPDISTLVDTAWKHPKYLWFCILPLEFGIIIDIHENSKVLCSNRNKSPKEMSGNSRL